MRLTTDILPAEMLLTAWMRLTVVGHRRATRLMTESAPEDGVAAVLDENERRRRTRKWRNPFLVMGPYVSGGAVPELPTAPLEAGIRRAAAAPDTTLSPGDAHNADEVPEADRAT